MKQPIQPIYTDPHGTLRFHGNTIVQHLLDQGGIDLNQLSRLTFATEDWVQFAQLIGYSVSGFGTLSYVSQEDYDVAEELARSTKDEWQVRAECLEDKLNAIRRGLRAAASEAFDIHPNDLQPTGEK